MQNEASRVSLGAVHTHTHTHTSTFRKIKRVANEATLFGVKNRLCVVLYLGKNVVLKIACFLMSKKIISMKLFFVEIDYVDYKEFLCNYHCLEILVICFSCCLKIMLISKLNFKTSYTNLKLQNELEIQGGVA